MTWQVWLGVAVWLAAVLAVNWWLAHRDERRGERIVAEFRQWERAQAYRRASREHPDGGGALDSH